MTDTTIDRARELPAHGGDRETYAAAFGRELIDFSINVNPLGVSPRAKAAIVAGLDGADRYPDTECRALRAALAELNNVDVDQVVCGNGAADLIARLAYALKPQQALVTAPTFSEYERALTQVDCAMNYYYLQPENGFALGEDILEAIVPELDLMILCEPNNPTGVVTDHDLLERIVGRCAECDVVLMIDECFNGFLDDPDAHTLRGLVANYPNLIILDSLTKTHGMAGIRLGYALCADTELLRKMRDAGQPWGVSHLAQIAGVAALEDIDYLREMHDITRSERPRMAAALEALDLTVFPSGANYLLFSTQLWRTQAAASEWTAADQPNLIEHLAQRGFLIRDCSNFHTLDQGYYRVAVRTPRENDALIAALEDVFATAQLTQTEVW